MQSTPLSLQRKHSSVDVAGSDPNALILSEPRGPTCRATSMLVMPPRLCPARMKGPLVWTLSISSMCIAAMVLRSVGPPGVHRGRQQGVFAESQNTWIHARYNGFEMPEVSSPSVSWSSEYSG